jgi:hypothetical protein
MHDADDRQTIGINSTIGQTAGLELTALQLLMLAVGRLAGKHLCLM